MVTEEHHILLRDLAKEYDIEDQDIQFVHNIADWCREQGITEPDRDRPMKIVFHESGPRMLIIRTIIPDETIQQRLNALDIRAQLQSVASDISGRLNSDEKKLAYLFLRECAESDPGIADELSADNWAFGEMENLGFFRQ